MTVQLFGHPFSSFTQKVLIALYEAETPFTFRVLTPEDPSTALDFAQLWPLQKFPVLVTGEQSLFESSVIIEYLVLHGRRVAPLIPKDPDAAIEVRMLDRFFDNYVSTPVQKIVGDRLRPEGSRDPCGVDDARALLTNAYRWIENALAERVWAAGNTFTMADCAAGPALFYADWVHEIDAAFTRTRAYRQRLLVRPSFARAIDAARPYRVLFPGGAPARD